MEYKEFRIENNGCTVIYGGTKEERDIFEKAFLSQNPEYQLQVLPCLRTVKKGLFGKKKTLLDTFLGEVSKSEKAEMEHRLKKQSSTLTISPMLNYNADQLSYAQKLLWSYVFEVAAGRKTFLFRDDTDPFNDVDICELVSYLQVCAGLNNFRIVWITARKIPDFMETIVPDKSVAIYSDELFRSLIKDASILDKCNHLYRLQYGSIYAEDRDALYQELKEQKQAEWEEIKHDATPKLEEAKRLEQNGRFTDALIIYKSLLPANIPEAIFSAGRLICDHGLKDPTIGSGMSLILTATDKYNYAPACIYLGDWEMANLEKSMENSHHSESAYDITTLKLAENYYSRAAKYSSAEGAYKAASLHLRFTTTENYDGDVSHDICSENAIPYIQKLMELKEKGDADAGYYLTMLQMKNPEIYRAAQTYFGL